MVLRIFIKRKAHGELCTKDYEFFEQLIEAPEILKAYPDPKSGTEGFRFVLKNTEGTQVAEAYCPTKTHGYEIKDASGNIIDRYITKIDD